jgi:glycerol-3-phosphate dehydrogenase
MFPNVNLSLKDIESSWSGLRPLIYEEGKSASEISRKDEIFISSTGLVSLAGGKLTGYRKMAKKVVDKIAKEISKKEGKEYAKCQTLKIPLNGNDFKSSREVSIYLREISGALAEYKIPDKYASYLVHNYGKQTDTILKSLDHFTETDPELRLLRSELSFCLNTEMVCEPLDFLERRTGRLYFWMITVEKYKKEILTTFKEKFGWTDGQLKDQEGMLTEAMDRSRIFN